MNNLVTLMYKETIKPSSSIKPSKPFKLCFIDQVMPTTYVPLILFYPPFQNSHFSYHLKISLSQTLSTFFPFSGRLHHNLLVDNFEKGIPFSETRVSIDMSDFLLNPQLDKLNQFLPTEPFTQILSRTESLPILRAQLNNFQCGGVALAICFSHKIVDVHSVCNFLRKWSEINIINMKNDPSYKETLTLNFDESSLRFPPFNSDPSLYISIMEKLFFNRGKRTTRRFVFYPKAISSLQDKATTITESGVKIRPTRIKTLSSFIWRCCTLASASISLTPRMSLSLHIVNFRKRTEPSLPEYSLGNLLWMVVSAQDIMDSAHNDARTSGLNDFVGLTNESFEEVNVEFLKSLEGEKGIEVATEFFDLFNETLTTNPEIFVFSSWVNFGINELDFGVGKPAWVSLMGEVGPALRNFTIFNECINNGGIEAWITLDDDLLDILEHDPEFLTFAVPNPSIFVENLRT